MKAAGKKFEIVFASSDRDQAAFDEYFAEMPWAAVPYSDRDTKNSLSKKFKVRGIPSFVIVDALTGETITDGGRAAISEDPEGENFPWRPPPFSEVIGDSFLRGAETVGAEAIEGKYLGVYFSAHWCGPCRGFTPKLAEWYKNDLSKKNFEIIFVSSDRDQAAFDGYLSEMPWLALPFSDRKRKAMLSDMFDVEGIPTFAIVGPDGKTINAEGRSAVSADPEGKEFPWHPKPVNDLSNGPEGINETPSLVVLMEKLPANKQAEVEAALTSVAEPIFADAKAKKEEAPFCFFTGKSAGGITDRVRQLCQGGDAGDAPQMFLLDIPDNGGYYKAAAGEITEANVTAFIEGYKA